jgi:2-dehydropantoate 2-reductase
VTSCVVVGPGAIGLLFACRLSAVLDDIALLDYRPDRARRLTSRGIRCITAAGAETTHRIPVVASAADVPFQPDALLYTTKAYATQDAAQHARDLGAAASVIVSLQNGMGNVEALSDVFGRGRCVAATTAQGATLVEEGVVRDAGAGVTRLAAVAPESSDLARSVASTLGAARFAAEVSDAWESVVWSKALVNCSINPLTALLSVRNGHLAESPSGRELVSRVAREGAAVAEAAGIDVPGDLATASVAVARATQRNISSMRQDFERGSRAELEQINGIIVARAAQSATPAHTLRAITLLARAKAAALRT